MTGIVTLEQCASTQDEVRTRLATAEAGDVRVVRARSQVAGRGRQGRTWHDAPGGEALLLSIGRRGPMPVAVLDDLARLVAMALLESLDADGAIAWKAPNDLVAAADGAKVAGVLVDARTTGSSVDEVIVGIGCNVTGDAFVTPDGREATSATNCTRASLDVERITARVVERVVALLRRAT